MTIEEMDAVIQEYCKHLYKDGDCIGCVIEKQCDSVMGCFGEFGDVCREAYEILVGHPYREHDGCVGCKHELKDNDELPCGHCRYTLLAGNPLHKICPDLYEPKIPENPYWERINAIAEKQRAKGINKYGVGLESNPAAILERINHLQEELIDGLMYCEWIKDHLND